MIDTKAIRAKVLDLALRGKLTEQRPEDGTAEELYRQILDEKHTLEQAGKIKKSKSLPPVTADEVSYEVPSCWQWVRFGNIITLLSGQDLKPEEYGQMEVGIPYLTGASNFDQYGVLVINRWTDSPKNIARKGDIILSCKGTVGKTAILTAECVHIARQFMAITTYCVDVNYIVSFIKSKVDELKAASKGLIPGIERDDVLNLPFPLPPLPEQHRIVAKIDAIFSQLDTIDTLQSQYQDNLATLKSKIIDAGIQGKLTEQLPEDGTAEELYQQIQQEKLGLEKAGKIKKSKPLPPISEEEKPFDIPANWKWVRLSNIIYDKPTNGFSPKGVDYPTKIKNLTLTATTSGVFKPEAYKYVDIPLEAANKYWLVKDDILIQRSNSAELVGTSCVFTGNDHEYIYPDLMMRIHVLPMVDTDYVARILKAPFTRQYYMSRASGSSGSMPKINQETVANTLVPLPPLAEQKRIVAKLEELLPLCEKLQ